MKSRTKNSATALISIGIDISKEVFHVVGFDADGKIALRRKVKRLSGETGSRVATGGRQ
jgi:transposase